MMVRGLQNGSAGHRTTVRCSPHPTSVGDLVCLDALLSCDVPALFRSAFSPSQAVSDHSAEQQDFGCVPKEKPASDVGLTGSHLPVRIRGTRHPSAMAHRAAITIDV